MQSHSVGPMFEPHEADGDSDRQQNGLPGLDCLVPGLGHGRLRRAFSFPMLRIEIEVHVQTRSNLIHLLQAPAYAKIASATQFDHRASFSCSAMYPRTMHHATDLACRRRGMRNT
jgi:hypothetical protein